MRRRTPLSINITQNPYELEPSSSSSVVREEDNMSARAITEFAEDVRRTVIAAA